MYFGCHNHTEYSNITTGLDSINKLEDLVNKAKEFGMRGIAITNHDNLLHIRFLLYLPPKGKRQHTE